MAATSPALAAEQREETIRFGEDHPLSVTEVARYVRADEERERLVETIRALVTTEDDGPEGAMGARWILGQVRAALEAHDAKGEAGDDAATRPPSPHSP